MPWRRAGAVGLLPLVLAATFGMIGCESVKTTEPIAKNSGLLQQGERPANMVGVDIFLIRITLQQQSLLQQLWLEVDEQMIPPMLRHELREQGMRIGIQGSYLSATLSQLINVTAQGDESFGGMNEVSVADLQRDPDVTRQYRNLLPGMRAVLRPFDDMLDELALFEIENGRVWGKTYKHAQGLICLSAKPQANGTVRFEVVPELEYGSPETKIRVQSAIVFHENGRPRRVFNPLTVSLDLLPGQWIILGATSSECSGIGRGFFIRGSEKHEQKIIAIRLAHVNPESPFGRSNVPMPEKSSVFPLPERN